MNDKKRQLYYNMSTNNVYDVCNMRLKRKKAIMGSCIRLDTFKERHSFIWGGKPVGRLL